ncbi:10774_t:CDS:2 [Funneliformis mosseae]|uniref:10774_t:CDS:1 n=1 Tax=Funneliformis mosseae TaxID=27381 RepID=A0A9N8ZUT0_FUNMO|nr:10774_t:CDS:2 [Funneliformis mosseae]
MALSFGRTQNGEEAMPVVMDVTKIPEVTDMLTSEQDEQDLSQSYEASSENIRSASCVLSKQPQELKQQLSSPAHTLSSDQILEQDSSSSDIAQNIACMFRKAIKVGQEAILYWCYFIEKYDKMIDNFVADGVKKKIATSMS